MKVGVIYPYFAHYRQPIIDTLEEDPLVEYFFLGGTIVGRQFNGMKLIESVRTNRFIKLKNHWFLKYFLIQSNLVEEVKKNRFDAVIIFADWKYLSTWRLLFYCKFKGITALFWSHGFRTNDNSLNSIIKLLYFKLFNGGFVYDSRAKRIFAEKGYKRQIDIVYNSLDFSLQSRIYGDTLQHDNQFIKQDKYVVFSGRLTYTKKLELLIDAIRILKNQDIKVNVILIGDGQHRNALINYSVKHGVSEQIFFYGSCYDESVIANCYINSVACVIPSAVGLSAIHSLSYGTPVLTNNNLDSHGPEIESVVNGTTGKFFFEGNAASLADGIVYFLSLSEFEREKYRINSRSIVEEKFNPIYQREIFTDRVSKIKKNG